MKQFPEPLRRYPDYDEEGIRKSMVAIRRCEECAKPLRRLLNGARKFRLREPTGEEQKREAASLESFQGHQKHASVHYTYVEGINVEGSPISQRSFSAFFAESPYKVGSTDDGFCVLLLPDAPQE